MEGQDEGGNHKKEQEILMRLYIKGEGHCSAPEYHIRLCHSGLAYTINVHPFSQVRDM